MDKSVKHVMVVDDDPALRHIMVTALRKAGYEVSSEENGKEADERIRKVRPDLVLLDVMMPGKNGLDVCRELKENPQYNDIPILMLTCLTEDSERNDDFWRNETGADDFITKPFPIGELLRRVENLTA